MFSTFTEMCISTDKPTASRKGWAVLWQKGGRGKCEALNEDKDSQNPEVGEVLEVRRVDHRQVVPLQVSAGKEQIVRHCKNLAEELAIGPLRNQRILYFLSQWLLLFAYYVETRVVGIINGACDDKEKVWYLVVFVNLWPECDKVEWTSTSL